MKASIGEVDQFLAFEKRFVERFRDTPVLRAKRTGLIRNACIVAANNRAADLLSILRDLSRKPDPIIRDHAEWAIEQIQR